MSCVWNAFKIIDSSDEAESSTATPNSSVEQVDLSQSVSITSLEDLKQVPSKSGSSSSIPTEKYGLKTISELKIVPKGGKQILNKSCHDEIEDIIRLKETDTSDPRHSKPTDCDLIALQKVKRSWCQEMKIEYTSSNSSEKFIGDRE